MTREASAAHCTVDIRCWNPSTMAILLQYKCFHRGNSIYRQSLFYCGVSRSHAASTHSLNVWSASVREGDCGKLCKSVQEGNWPGASIESDTDGFQQGSRLLKIKRKLFLTPKDHIASHHLQSATLARRMFRLHFQYFAEQEQNELRLI